jgi:hypothetical protein
VGDVRALANAMVTQLPRVDPTSSPIGGWTYERGVQQFHEAVRLAMRPSAVG